MGRVGSGGGGIERALFVGSFAGSVGSVEEAIRGMERRDGCAGGRMPADGAPAGVVRADGSLSVGGWGGWARGHDGAGSGCSTGAARREIERGYAQASHAGIRVE